MKRIFVVLAALMCLTSFAQEKEAYRQQSDLPKWRVGGGLGMQFGTYTNIRIAPTVERRIADWYYLGGTIDYSYIKFNDFSQSIIGAGILNTAYPTRFLFLNANFMAHNARFYENEDREWVPSLWLGGGYQGRMGPVLLSLGLQYNVLDDPDKRIYDPLMPIIGISVGL